MIFFSLQMMRNFVQWLHWRQKNCMPTPSQVSREQNLLCSITTRRLPRLSEFLSVGCYYLLGGERIFKARISMVIQY